MEKNIIKTIILSVLIFVIGFSFILAWEGPTANPPSSNTPAPINIGVNPQVKEGSLQSDTDIRAPIFYDYPSTDYYADPAGNSWLYRLYSYDVRSDIFYDRNNTAYYVDPAGASYMSDVRADIYYDRNNTGYYIDPASTSKFNTVYASAYYYGSDRQLKKDIEVINNSLDKLLQLEGVSFKWKNEEIGKNINLGLIAQDVEKIFPEIVSTNEISGLKSVQYGNLVAPLIEAIKELSSMADKQQKQINTLELRIKELETK